MNSADWIAIYAAIVATGALFLEVRRWFESGPKIKVRASPGMSLVSQGSVEKENLLMVNVTNTGNAPTTITHFGLLEYPNTLARWRRKPSKSYLVLRPQSEGSPPIIPYVLKVGEQWTGMAQDRSEETGDVQSGQIWVAIYTTARERPFLSQIKKRAPTQPHQEADKI